SLVYLARRTSALNDASAMCNKKGGLALFVGSHPGPTQKKTANRSLPFSWCRKQWMSVVGFSEAATLLVVGLVLLLPFRHLRRMLHLHRRHLVLGAVGRPVAELRGDHVGTGFRHVEGRVDHARLHAVADPGMQGDFTLAALQLDQLAILDTALVG